MAARVTSTGIRFSDDTILTTKFGIIPENSVTIFYQASAPPRWTKSTTHNDKTLRVVSDAGGGYGGSLSFTTVFPNSLKNVSETYGIIGSVGGHTLVTSQIASHAHGNGGSIALSGVAANYDPDGNFSGWNGGDVARAGGWSRSSPGPGTAGFFAGGEAHSHPWSGSAVFSQNIDLRVQYIDVISCTFNG